MQSREKKQHIATGIEGLLEIIILAILYYLMYTKIGIGAFGYRGKYILMGVYALIVVVIFYLCDSFKYIHRKVTDITLSQWISILVVNFVTYFQLCLIANGMLNPWPLVLLTVVDCICVVLLCNVYSKVNYKIFPAQELVFVYGEEKFLDLKEKFSTRNDMYTLKKSIPVSCGMEVIKGEILNSDGCVIGESPLEQRNEILKFCYEKDITSFLLPQITDVIIRGSEELNAFDTPIYMTESGALSPEEDLIKRLADILISVIAMIPCGIVMIFIAVAIKLDDGGPIFYKQKRVTLNNREFGMMKFRSMIVDAEKYTGAVLAAEDDPRITKVGKFLRAHRLDELPQIINILLGDMSIVGPRPERRELIEETTKVMPEFAFRTKVKGGLTGYAQVYGKYNTQPYDKLKLDMAYIQNYSLLLDLKIMFMTLQILFKKDSTEGVKR